MKNLVHFSPSLKNNFKKSTLKKFLYFGKWNFLAHRLNNREQRGSETSTKFNN